MIEIAKARSADDIAEVTALVGDFVGFLGQSFPEMRDERIVPMRHDRTEAV